MKYLISVIDDRSASAKSNEMAEIDKFNDKLRVDGHWVFAGGLESPSTATVIDNRDGVNIFTDGPLIESKDYFSGCWIIDAPDLETARKLATEGSKACNRRVELRQFHG